MGKVGIITLLIHFILYYIIYHGPLLYLMLKKWYWDIILLFTYVFIGGYCVNGHDQFNKMSFSMKIFIYAVYQIGQKIQSNGWCLFFPPFFPSESVSVEGNERRGSEVCLCPRLNLLFAPPASPLCPVFGSCCFQQPAGAGDALPGFWAQEGKTHWRIWTLKVLDDF